MARDNASIARRWVEGFNTENLTIAEEIIAPTYVMHDLHIPHLGRGPESYKKHIMSTHEAFPDCQSVPPERSVVYASWRTEAPP
jgi:hypothetical protein